MIKFTVGEIAETLILVQQKGCAVGLYRARLFDLLNQGGYWYEFEGSTINNSNRLMISAGQAYHNGYGSYRIDQMVMNLDGSENEGGFADDNMGGYWMVGGHNTFRGEVSPDVVLILAGTNDLGAWTPEPVVEKRMTELLTWFKTNRPNAQIFVGTVPPRGPNKTDFQRYNTNVEIFNSWIKQNLPNYGANYHCVNIYSILVDSTGNVKDSSSSDKIYLADGIHPSHNGYWAMGDAWFNSITCLLKTRSL